MENNAKDQPRLIDPALHNHFQYSQADVIKANIEKLENNLKYIKLNYRRQEDSTNYQEQVKSIEQNIEQLKSNLSIASQQYEEAEKEIQRTIKEAAGRQVQYIDSANNQLIIYNYYLENGEVKSTQSKP